MKVLQKQFAQKKLDTVLQSGIKEFNPNLILVFAPNSIFENKQVVEDIRSLAPSAKIIGCSTAGEISDEGVYDNHCVITAVKFSQDPMLNVFSVKSTNLESSFSAGKELGKKFSDKKLHSLFVLSKGTDVNGSGVIDGIKSVLTQNVLITGGLAGDYGAFKKTFVLNDNEVGSDMVVAIGFGNPNIKIGFGSMGGWEEFGPLRKITKAKGNILFTIDDKPALEVYKQYLGEHANKLPAAGLLFPLEIKQSEADTKTGLIRTILGIDEKNGSLILAGDIHENTFARLMNAKTNALVQAAGDAARQAMRSFEQHNIDASDQLAILVSCVGRKLVMGADVEEEVEAVKDVFPKAHLAGFYSNGEICPSGVISDCQLHNQTMTITWISEAA